MTIACSKGTNVNSDRTPASLAPAVVYEKFLDEKLTLTLPHEDLDIPPAVVGVRISYTGKNGMQKVFKQNENLILDLIRTQAANFSLMELREVDSLKRFEKELLKSIDIFIAKDTFIHVQVSEIREI